jgi:hypothetical protein
MVPTSSERDKSAKKVVTIDSIPPYFRQFGGILCAMRRTFVFLMLYIVIRNSAILPIRSRTYRDALVIQLVEAKRMMPRVA